MFKKKVILPIVAFAMVGLVGCGDDSSSSPTNSSKELPSSVKKIEDAINQTCTPTENFCAKIFVEEFADTVQCDGKQFTPMMLGKPVEGCETAAPADPGAGEAPADPGAGETPAEPGAGEAPAEPGAGEAPAEPGAGEAPAGPGAGEAPAEPGAGETPAEPGAGEAPAEPGAGETPAGPGAGETPAAGGNVVYCVVPGVMGGCEELPAEAAAMCESTLEGQLVDACPAE